MSDDKQVAEAIRTLVTSLNEGIAEATRRGIRIELDTYGTQGVWMTSDGESRKIETAPKLSVTILKGL